MAVPSDMTATLICTEAYKKVGVASPGTTALTRAEGYFLREILSDITKTRDRYGNKVKFTVLYRGRELAHKEQGRMVLDRVEADLAELGAVEAKPRFEGRTMHMVVAPVPKSKQKKMEPPPPDDEESAEPVAAEPVVSEPVTSESESE